MRKKILVIDDEKAIRRSFELTFENSDYLVETVSNGEEGLGKITQNDYDLVFLDLKMPKMNGVEVLEKINQKKKDIKIYIVTAFHQEFFNQLIDARNKGYEFEILQKPLGSNQLRIVVDTILGEYSI